MKNRMHQIITEAINNTLLMNNLRAYGRTMLSYANRLKNTNNANGGILEIVKFHNDLCIFVDALYAALSRCLQSGNLNEAYYGNYGMNILNNAPILTNFYHSFVDGLNTDVMGTAVKKYNALKDAWSGRNNNNNNGSTKISLPNRNDKLMVILTQYYPLINQQYARLNRKYNNALESMNPPLAKYIIGEVEKIIGDIRNAQGQRP